jgi:NADH:ubiquinone oxidoreductase subunit 4 (subunit M)
MLGPASAVTTAFSPMTKQDKIILIVLVALVAILGVYPDPIMKMSNTAVESILATIR